MHARGRERGRGEERAEEGSGVAGGGGRRCNTCASILVLCARILLAPAWKTRSLRCHPQRKEGRKESSQGVGDLVRADARNNTHLVNVTQPTHSENKHLNFLAALQTFNTVPTRAHAHAHTHAGLCIF